MWGLIATGWLLTLMRTPEPAWLTKQQSEAPDTADAEDAARANDDRYPVAAGGVTSRDRASGPGFSATHEKFRPRT